MVSMQDYINSIKSNTINNSKDFEDKTKSQSSFVIPNIAPKNDSFEKEDNKIDTSNDKKIDKKKVFKIGAIIAGIGLAILAFLKRKQISSALSNLFSKKKPLEPPTPPQNIPTSNIPNSKTSPTIPASKSTQITEPKVNPDIGAKKPTEQINQGIQKNTGKIIKEIPKPTFGDNPTIEEKQQYTSKVLEYINTTEDQDAIIQALDKIQQYGTADDLERINANVWMTAKEPLIVKLSQTIGQIGGKDADIQLVDYMRPLISKLSCDSYVEVFKAATKLSISYDGKIYDELISHLNNIPSDKNGNFTEALTEMLISVGKKEYISMLDDYLRNYGYVNDFMNKGQKTPQAVLDVIDKVRVGLENKDKEN